MRQFRKSSLLALAVFRIAIVGASPFTGEPPNAAEAPSGFTTPTLSNNPGSLSSGNGIPEPPGDSFTLDQSHFEEQEGMDTGLGPTYNATSCVSCHQNPVTGGGSQITELRVGHNDALGNFINPTVWINDRRVAISGRSVINDRAICAEAQEHVPDQETIRSLRITPSLLGDGYVEAVPDEALISLAQKEVEASGGRIVGEYVMVPVMEAPGIARVGRFGWKDQHASLLSFAAQAYLDEVGVTNRVIAADVTTVCKRTEGVEDHPDEIGMADIDHFAQFTRATKAPPRDPVLILSPLVRVGSAVFRNIGCELCHTSTLKTALPGTMLNGGTYTVSEAIGNKTFHPYSDFLLHEVGTGDGIVQAGRQETANKIRTAPLWGLRTRNRYLHDGRALTLDDAIDEHQAEAAEATTHYHQLNREERKALLAFLSSL